MLKYEYNKTIILIRQKQQITIIIKFKSIRIKILMIVINAANKFKIFQIFLIILILFADSF
jgi:hypothetical protein